MATGDTARGLTRGRPRGMAPGAGFLLDAARLRRGRGRLDPRLVGRLVGGDLFFASQRQADVVQSFQDAFTGERIERERDRAARRVDELLRFEIDGELAS